MSWLNPVAFLGLFALAVPIVVHLFGRRAARRQRFPSLRLLREAQPTPATRSRPSDVMLLVLRCLTIAAAATALAQPRWSDAGGPRKAARVVIVDTSASMQRLTSDGTAARQMARTLARQLVDSSGDALLIETDRPGRSLAGATSWLTRLGGVREVVVTSDFQEGSVGEADLATVQPGIGIRLVRVDATGAVATSDTVGGVVTEAMPDRTQATWISSGTDSTVVTVLGGAGERDALDASVAAARSLRGGAAPSGRRVTMVFPDAPARRELLAQVAPIDSAWHGDLVLALARDPLLASAARAATVVPSCETGGVGVARNDMDEAIASVARGHNGLLVFACVRPGGLAAAALVAGIESALRPLEPMRELEPNFVPDETLRRWRRPGIESAPRGPGVTSPDGRWIWLIALAFLLAEEVLRRRSPRRESPGINEVRNERVA